MIFSKPMAWLSATSLLMASLGGTPARAASIVGADREEILVTEKGGRISMEYWCIGANHEWKKCEDLGSFEKAKVLKAKDDRKVRDTASGVTTIAGHFGWFAGLFMLANPVVLVGGLVAVGAGALMAPEPVPVEFDDAIAAVDRNVQVRSAARTKDRMKEALAWLDREDARLAEAARAKEAEIQRSPAVSERLDKGSQLSAPTSSSEPPVSQEPAPGPVPAAQSGQ